MRVVVTGAAGLTGGSVAEELIRRGHDVVGVVRRPETLSALATGVEGVVADCSDAGRVRDLVGRADGLVHVAGIGLARSIVDAGIGRLYRLVVVSTAGIYSRFRASAHAYRRWEDLLRSAHPDIVLIRPTMIYGSKRDRNVHRVIEFARRARFLPVPLERSGRIQPIHYSDLAQAIASLVEGDAVGVVDAGGPDPITLRHAAKAVLTGLGLQPILVPIPVRPLAALAGAIDALDRGRRRERLLRLGEERTVDNARLSSLTGVLLRSFESGVADEIHEMTATTR